MECSECGSYRHNTNFCQGVQAEINRNDRGRYLCPKCGRPWGQSNYAAECCTTDVGAKRRGQMLEAKYVKSEEEGWRGDYLILEVYHNGELILSETDGGEPEDNTFYRDWNWVKGAIEKAYALGVEDGKKGAK